MIFTTDNPNIAIEARPGLIMVDILNNHVYPHSHIAGQDSDQPTAQSEEPIQRFYMNNHDLPALE